MDSSGVAAYLLTYSHMTVLKRNQIMSE